MTFIQPLIETGTIGIVLTTLVIITGLLLVFLSFSNAAEIKRKHKAFNVQNLLADDCIYYLSRLSKITIFLMPLIIATAVYLPFKAANSNINDLDEREQKIESLYKDLESKEQELKDTQEKLAKFEASSPEEMADETEINQLRTAYEKAFVNFFYLSRCGKASVDEGSIMFNLMVNDLARSGADAAEATYAVESASATFRELYAGLPCDEQTIAPIEAAQKSYIKAARENLSALYIVKSESR